MAENDLGMVFIYCPLQTCRRVNIISDPKGDEQVGFFCLGCKNTYLIGRKEEEPPPAQESER